MEDASPMLRWLFWLLFLPITLPIALLRSLTWALARRGTLEVTLRGALTDVASGGRFLRSPSTPHFTLLAALGSAETDSKLQRVLVKIEAFRGGLARAEELRVALESVKRAGKDVIVVAEHLDLGGYWIALAASRVHLSPTGSLDVAGVASEFTLWKGLLDKVGIRARLAARGKYKSMRESFASDTMSGANREMLESLVGDLYRQLEERIASGRALPQSDVRGIVDQGPFRADVAHRLGLIDVPRYESDVREELEATSSRKLTPAKYLARRQRRWLPLKAPRIALLQVQGGIQLEPDATGMFRAQSASAQAFVRACERVQKDKSIRAILLRVNSPGGSALGSDLMWHALSQAAKGRGLFVSMGNVAASGGYYVSGVPGARIFASPCTITGSIGVVGGKFEATRLYERLGVSKELIQVGRHATFHSSSVDFDAEQLEKLQRDIDALYEDFVAKMAEGRGLEKSTLESVAQGRVWTGAQALENHLVDEIGGVREALDAIRKHLGRAPHTPLGLVVLDQPGLFERLRAARGSAQLSTLTQLLPDELFTLLEMEASRERLLFRMPFDVKLS
jgi:protease IV